MTILRIALSELIGMFIDDGSLATLCLILILLIAGAVEILAFPPLAGGLLLLVGCLTILFYSVRRAVKR
ncbi:MULTISPECIES: hypothetical protein [Rhizobium]|jgi:hypothetical protein|uniref:Uncharacterized protein n=1 Tax=Rhizobium tropici TaxID=398 RepID=A0A329YH54_RHITR|nr:MULTISPECIES: hypothetical protein [Rhizobium]MBB3287837.1 hypothetical protein [Rhizobium sp. BK252]MBB3402559.1 hypothetical protein [Rhizobium sp. BK289]MBB3415135.1 hypothetical protein [Rhizobium sp. BK284]MBB3483024.1 hypothetical protein [Rhizobium sp. BK347]MDK4720649.1 hypothetical protein [Rhizobium sp. CNPSo 3968]